MIEQFQEKPTNEWKASKWAPHIQEAIETLTEEMEILLFSPEESEARQWLENLQRWTGKMTGEGHKASDAEVEELTRNIVPDIYKEKWSTWMQELNPSHSS